MAGGFSRGHHPQALDDAALDFVAGHVADELEGGVGGFALRVDVERIAFGGDHRTHGKAGGADDRKRGDGGVDVGIVQVVGPAPVAVDDHGGAAGFEERVGQLVVAVGGDDLILFLERGDEAVGGDGRGGVERGDRRGSGRRRVGGFLSAGGGLGKDPAAEAGEKRNGEEGLGEIPDEAVAFFPAAAVFRVDRVGDGELDHFVGRLRRRLDEVAIVDQGQMIAEAIADLDELALGRVGLGRQVGERTVDEITLQLGGEPRRQVLQEAHRLERVEHVGGTVDELGPGAGQRRRLKAAAQLLGFLVEGADVDVWVGGLEAGDFVGEELALGGPRLMPDRDDAAMFAGRAAGEEAEQQANWRRTIGMTRADLRASATCWRAAGRASASCWSLTSHAAIGARRRRTPAPSRSPCRAAGRS